MTKQNVCNIVVENKSLGSRSYLHRTSELFKIVGVLLDADLTRWQIGRDSTFCFTADVMVDGVSSEVCY